MDVRDILPVLLPGILLQLSVQVLYVGKCLRDESLTPNQRRLYAVMIAIFHLPAAAVYLLKSGGKSPSGATPGEDQNTAPHIRKGIFFLLVTAYEVMGIHLLTENAGNPLYVPLTALLSLSFVFMLLYNLLPLEGHAAAPLFPVLQLILCVPILYLDLSGDNLYLALIAGISAINRAPLPQAKVYGIGALGVYLAGSAAKAISLSGVSETDRIVQYFFVNALVVLLALFAFYTLKKQMVTSGRLDAALHRVREQSEQLRELVLIEERNRIAAEMHDTVGHTLTAAVLSLEAAEGLVSGSPSAAAQKINQGKEQVRRGLAELRASVRAVRTRPKGDFTAALEQLLQEIGSDTGLVVHTVAEAPVDLPPLQAGILLSAVKECATNAIRHGHASQADLLIQQHKGWLRLAFTDNGGGSLGAGPGAGLTIMRERVRSAGGTLEIETAPGEGFTVSLTIPTGQERENEP